MCDYWILSCCGKEIAIDQKLTIMPVGFNVLLLGIKHIIFFFLIFTFSLFGGNACSFISF